MDIDVLERIGRFGHEGVYTVSDTVTGLQAIIGVHSTTLGPALGGTRIRPYSSFADALEDVLRLSRAMTYKAAVAGLQFGGGKAVIVGDPLTVKSEALLEAYGKAVDALGGKYVTAEDVGSTVADMSVVRRQTPYVSGLSVEEGGSGDPSPATARGVLAGMKATSAHIWGTSDLAGRRVVVQGVGKVGGVLASLLSEEGCDLAVADVADGVAEELAERIGATVIAPDQALLYPCDILSPCALGGILNARSIPTLECAAVVGSANNQLAEDSDADRLSRAGIVYAPDFVVNAGGIDNIAEEFHADGYSEERALVRVAGIGGVTTRVLERAREQSVTTVSAARRLAEERLVSG